MKYNQQTKSEIMEGCWLEFLVHCKTHNTIAKIENDKYEKEHPGELDRPYQTVWVNEQNFWEWYMQNKMPTIKVKREEKKKDA